MRTVLPGNLREEKQMKKKYLLPTLKGNEEVDEGIGWQEKDNIYEYLIKELQLYYEPNRSIFDGGSNAFPHMFEQMLLFHRAFLNEKDPEHERAVLEWRAVLALMALQRVCNTKLDVVKVDFVEKTGNMFLRAAETFRPVDVPVFFNSTWDQIYILMLWNTPIALFSPITLVCPAKQFFNKLKENMKEQWIVIEKVNGKEILRFKYGDDGIKYQNLVAWLKRLKNSLSSSNNEIDECSYKFERVKEELDSYYSYYEKKCHHNTNILFLDDIYSSMNNATRDDFSFLNFCCDVHLDNKKLLFLLNWYINDIFEQKLLVFVYDNMPDTMEKGDNLYKIEHMFNSALRINGKSIIEVHEYKGKRVAAYALLPLKEKLINELIQKHITPEEFFEQFDITYYPSSRKMEVSLKVKEFPYQFSMSYVEEDWQLVYSSDMENVYLWPDGRMRNSAWKMYYMYTAENKKGIEVSLLEAKEKIKITTPSSFSVSNCFCISRTESFPAFVKYSHKGVTGFLPIEAVEFGSDAGGKTAYVSLDIGHATSSLAINANRTSLREQAENDNRALVLPSSLKVAGIKDNETAVNYNFIGVLQSPCSRSYIKNMIHSFRNYHRISKNGNGRRPIEDGEILFQGENYLNDVDGQIVSYINFEYDSLHQLDKELAHIFIEQLLLFITYQAYKQNCSYLDICYTHGYEDECAGFGELEGLYQNALQRIQSDTGIMKTGISALHGVPEYEALAHYVYQHMLTENGVEGNNISKDCVYVGVNIGWKNTWISSLETEDEKINVKYLKMNYGGRNISLMDEDGKGNYQFKSYYKMLGILMSGGTVQAGSIEEQLLNKFKELYESTKHMPKEYYQGIFDTIAMKIEENGYIVSPDVCNNVLYFRHFVTMLTYNILILLMSIASILGKICQSKKIKLLIGGNGSKLFQWVSNHKYNYKKGEVLEDGNSRRYWILSTEETILDYMNTAGDQSGNTFSLQLVGDAAEQMIKGCSYWRMAGMSVKERFSFERVPEGSVLDISQGTSLIDAINGLECDLFAGINRVIPGGVSTIEAAEDAVKIIEERRVNNCKYIIDEIESVIGVQ